MLFGRLHFSQLIMYRLQLLMMMITPVVSHSIRIGIDKGVQRTALTRIRPKWWLLMRTLTSKWKGIESHKWFVYWIAWNVIRKKIRRLNDFIVNTKDLRYSRSIVSNCFMIWNHFLFPSVTFAAKNPSLVHDGTVTLVHMNQSIIVRIVWSVNCIRGNSIHCPINLLVFE